jgi:hypothetical protein
MEHFRIPSIPGDVYLLLCDGAPVTVRSQQIRALNLLSALHLNGKIEGASVAVIGGGAGGLMFAAGAASLGAQVELFEKSSALLHLQRGCWHRPLHPEIFKWPDDTAYRAASHLPLLGWAAGRAHDVADEILTKFRAVQAHVGESSLKVNLGQPAQLTANGLVLVSSEERSFQIVVLAVGFGVEDLPYDLPWNNYWRADPLDQAFLDEGPDVPHILVVGSGDGALIEILRSCVQTFELGALLDWILNATLGSAHLRDTVKRIEGEEKSRYERYCEIESPSALDILERHLRRTCVSWLMKEDVPFQRFSLPVNRFVVSQLIRLSNSREPKDQFLKGPLCSAEVLGVDRVWRSGNGRYSVRYMRGEKEAAIECDHAVIRYGAERESSSQPASTRRALLKSVTAAIAEGPKKNGILEALRERSNRMAEIGDHVNCHEPMWEKGFDDDIHLRRIEMSKPTLHARFVKAFSPDIAGGRWVYRVHIRAEGVPEYLRLIYDLHSETGRVVSRVAGGPQQEQWLNTYGNYTIRARTNEGSEWYLGTVVEALERGRTRQPIPTFHGDEQSFDVAIANLESHRARPSEVPPTPAASAVSPAAV